MTKISIALLAALALATAGCKKDGGADCGQAIAHSMELSKATMAKMPGVDDKLLGKMKDTGIQSCQDDKWSPDVIKCMTDAKAESDAQACYGKLSSDQRAKMQKAAMALVAPAAPAAAAGSAAPTPGSAAAPAGGW